MDAHGLLSTERAGVRPGGRFIPVPRTPMVFRVRGCETWGTFHPRAVDAHGFLSARV